LKLLQDVKEKRKYCNWKAKAFDRTVWGNRFGRDCGPVALQKDYTRPFLTTGSLWQNTVC